jgi:transposase
MEKVVKWSMTTPRTPYPGDVSDEEWAFVVPYLLLLPEDAGQRSYSLREVFNGLRWIARAGAPWRMMPNDLPPWYIVYQQTQHWLAADCFAAIVDDLRLLSLFDPPPRYV